MATACAVSKDEDPFMFGDEVTGDDGTAGTTMNVTSADDDSASMTGQSTDPTDTASDTGAVGLCGPGAQCVTAPPEGWFGPVAIHLGEVGGTPPDCAAGYPEKGLSLLAGYADPEPASCDCECVLQNANSCTAYAYDMDASCAQYQTYIPINMACQPAAIDGGAYFYTYAMGQPFCQGMVTENIPEPQWEAQLTTCKADGVGGECGDDSICTPIVPEGFEDTLCIYMEGEQDCPAGDFTEQFVHHSGVVDDRDCTYCGCGPAPATNCTGTLNVFSSADCSGDPIANCSTNACTSGITGGQSVSVDYGESVGCPVMTPPAVEGSIAPTGAFTYCCTP